ncbi:MAG TPA: TetR/AcrR family transcriptional regulator [Polyangiaceae bacterium]|nr:TetR/AcrR family transcriptional regulator [Polyangiaceae bacterium]
MAKHKPAARSKQADAPVNGKRERNKAQNRAEILNAARGVFTELGYDAATVRDVIRRTRLGSGTFYNYFPDKESVFRALLQQSEERRLEWLAKVERGGGYEEYLRDSLRAYFEFVVTDRTTFDLLQRNAATIRSFARDPLIVDEHARLAGVLEHEMRSGVLPTANAEYLASSMIGMCFEIAVLMVKRDPVDIDSATEFVTNLFLGFFERARREGGRRERRAASAD